MAHLRNTLESAGYLYNPFVASDIWGAPPMVHLPDTADNLPVGADSGALPEFTQRSVTNSGLVQGSVTQEVHVPAAEESASTKKILMLVGFAAIIAFMLYQRR